MHKMVSSRASVLRAADYMGRDDLRESPAMRSWLNDAENKIGGINRLERKIKQIEINSDKRTALLPCELKSILGILLGKQSVNSESMFNEYCISKYTTTVDYSSLDVGLGNVVVMQPDKTEVSSSAEIYDVIFTSKGPMLQFRNVVNSNEYITILYLAYQTDEDGYILVPENHVEPLALYLMWIVARRSRYGSNKMTEGDVARAEMDWHKAKKSARASTDIMTPEQRAQIVALVNNPLSGLIRNY